MAVYDAPSLEKLLGALARADLFLVGEMDGAITGYLIVVVPLRTDAAEITDLAVDMASRRLGLGRTLIEAAARWARERGHRSLWVEPRADNHAAIKFYVTLGFRVAGFNDRMYSNADHEDGRPTIFAYLELS